MFRTAYRLPTTLSGHELRAALLEFLMERRFRKAAGREEGLYRIGGWWQGTGCLRLEPGEGFVDVEAFYRVGWFGMEYSLERARADPHRLRVAVHALSVRLSGRPPAGAAPPEAEAMPAAGPPGARPKNPAKACCLAAAAASVCLIGGCVALGLWHMKYGEPGGDHPPAGPEGAGQAGTGHETVPEGPEAARGTGPATRRFRKGRAGPKKRPEGPGRPRPADSRERPQDFGADAAHAPQDFGRARPEPACREHVRRHPKTAGQRP